MTGDRSFAPTRAVPRALASSTLAFAASLASPAGAEPCAPLRADEPVLLLVLPRDPGLHAKAPLAERALRRAAGTHLALLPADSTLRAMTVEGGAEDRERAVVEARVVIARAEDRFRELDDEEALTLIAKATAQLGSAHQEPDAIELLSRAHLLAGAIYLARGRTDAARQRLQRALDLVPDLRIPRDRYAPEVLAEVAAVRAGASVRPTGRLLVDAKGASAAVFLDGRLAGRTPLVLDAAPVGNHLVRVASPGRTSHVETLLLTSSEDTRLVVDLAPDPELSALATLPGALARREDVAPILDLVARRAGARRVLLATLELSTALSPTASATIALDLTLTGGGRAYAPSLGALPTALGAVLTCADPRPVGARLAPSLLDVAPPSTSRPEAVPPARPIYERPWFWGVAALAAIGLSGALVIARTAGGPPEAVEVRLVPRP